MKWLWLVLMLLATPLAAVQPDEMLADPALEARARAISAELRCPVCRNESIDESNAPVARDLRLMVRERLVAGDTDAQVIAAVVDRFGEFSLLKPEASGANLILRLAPNFLEEMLFFDNLFTGDIQRLQTSARLPALWCRWSATPTRWALPRLKKRSPNSVFAPGTANCRWPRCRAAASPSPTAASTAR